MPVYGDLMDMRQADILNHMEKALQRKQASFRMIRIEHLTETEAELRQLHASGLFQDEFFEERLTFFRFSPPDDFKNVQSIILVTVPQPILIINFMHKGIEYPVTLPPTYDQHTDQIIRELLETILNHAGYRLMRARIPEKMVAAHSGLIQYGRNNIGYAQNMGSFHRPVTFFTDMPCDTDHWGFPAMMERCKQCRACIKACPTHAIGEDRFLLHAERCLTFHNEHLATIPEYVKPSMHHCILGCMICQQVCPENRKLKNNTEVREHFTEKETTDILKGVSYDQLDPVAQKKLDQLSLTEDYSLLARNLGLLLR